MISDSDLCLVALVDALTQEILSVLLTKEIDERTEHWFDLKGERPKFFRVIGWKLLLIYSERSDNMGPT